MKVANAAGVSFSAAAGRAAVSATAGLTLAKMKVISVREMRVRTAFQSFVLGIPAIFLTVLRLRRAIQISSAKSDGWLP